MGDYKFSESDIIDNSVLFIDEVDATKNEINNIIIENSLKSTIDLIPLVHRITSPFIQWQGNTSNKVKGLIPDNDKQLNVLSIKQWSFETTIMMNYLITAMK